MSHLINIFRSGKNSCIWTKCAHTLLNAFKMYEVECVVVYCGWEMLTDLFIDGLDTTQKVEKKHA